MSCDNDSLGKRVLIVEDEMIQGVLLQKLIEEFDFKIVGTAKSGREAIEKINHLKPDIVTMDIQLEDEIDGITVVQEVTESVSPNVIFISGNSDSLNYTRAKEVGFVAFIAKPVQKEELKTALRKCVLLIEKGAA